ncbi:MAG: DUF465 domain-containing protein [Halieaceae bacterium]|nr:DUF465 domain-containing protein [Halieaceae bacterium]
MSDPNTPDEPVAVEAANELTLEARLQQVQEEHRALDEEIEALYEFPYRDQLQLQRLKKKKLQLKDHIERLKDELIPDLNA